MSKNQKSLRWHRQRAYKNMVATHCQIDIDADNCNEAVVKMLKRKIHDTYKVKWTKKV